MSEHNIDNYLSVNQPSYFEVWRLKVNGNTNTPNPAPQPTQRRYGYRVDEIKHVNGLWQIRNNFLAPKGFNWTDNGINAADVDMIDPKTRTMLSDQQTINAGMYFAFNESRVTDTGQTEMDQENLYRKFRFPQPTGDIWLVRESKQQLVFG